MAGVRHLGGPQGGAIHSEQPELAAKRFRGLGARPTFVPGRITLVRNPHPRPHRCPWRFRGAAFCARYGTGARSAFSSCSSSS